MRSFLCLIHRVVSLSLVASGAKGRRRLALPLAAAVLVCLTAAGARAATLTVTNNGDSGAGSLRVAINQANVDNNNDTIEFSVTGTITLASALPPITASMTIAGPGANQLTVSGANAYSIFAVGTSTSPTVSISGLTIANGIGYGSPGDTFGGGLLVDNGSVTVDRCTFFGNTAFGGGAIYSFSTLVVSNSSFLNNIQSGAYYGGAIVSQGATATIFNSTFVGNSAYDGGAIASLTGAMTVSNSTFYSNNAAFGGAIYTFPNAITTLENNLFSGNTEYAAVFNNGGTSNGSYNVYWNNPNGNCSGCTSDTYAVSAGSNPLTLPLGYYGGTTETLLPQLGSAAICAGNSADVPSGVTTDQRSFAMSPSYSQCANGSVDAGAVQANYIEVQASSDGTADAADCPGASCTLRDAIALANTSGGDIDFASAVSSVILASTNGALALSSSTGVNIVGPGASSLAISGNGAVQVFNIASGATTLISGVTVKDGLSTSAASGGGGIYNDGTLTLSSCVVTGNQQTNSGIGAGIFNDTSGNLTIDQCTVSNDAAAGMAGIGGGLANDGAAAITDSTFSGNIALGGSAGGGTGGAIENAGTLSIIGSTITGNSVTDPDGMGGATGGAIMNLRFQSALTISNSTIAGNSQNGTGTGDQAGGIFQNGTATLTNTILAGNTDTGGYPDGSGTFIAASAYNLIGNGNGISGISNGSNNNVVGSSASPVNPNLSSLQYNGTGATLETLIPLPGSPAICAGAASYLPSGATTDERGFPVENTTYAGYSSSSPCVDAGAVQTNYTGVQFVTQPAGSTASTPGTVLVGNAISPAPSVEVLETDTNLSAPNNTDAVNGVTVLALSLNSNPTATLTGSTSQTTGNGVATFSGLTVSAAGTGDTLYTLAIPITGSADLPAVTSYGFNVVSPNPVVTQVSPSFGPIAGFTPVAITGARFTGATSVSFGGIPATSFTVISDTQITAVSPVGAGAEIVDVTVTNTSGTSAANPADQFTYFAPVVTSLTPSVTPSATFVYNNQPGISVALAPSTATGITAAEFSATLDGTTALTVTAGTGANVFNLALPATPLTVGSHSIVIDVSGVLSGVSYYASSTVTIPLTVTAPNYVVTTTADDAGAPSNCTSGGSGCSLRDALAAATAAGGAHISFDSTVFAAAQTITLTNGTLNIPSTTTITGPTTGSGATLTNLVTVAGGGPSSDFPVFTVGSGVSGAAITSLTIANGNSSSLSGGGIYSFGAVTVTGCTFSGNSASAGGGIASYGTLTVSNSVFSGNSSPEGGGIYSYSGTLTVTNSTFSGNSGTYGGGIYSTGTMALAGSTFSGNSALYDGGAVDTGNGTITNSTFFGNSSSAVGGAIYNEGTLTVTNSTISGNSTSQTPGLGGGIFNQATLTLTNSIISGNSTTSSFGSGAGINGNGATVNANTNVFYNNLDSAGFEDDCANICTNTNVIYGDPKLLPLGNYGGTTQTMLPQPGSAAICAGLAANIPAGVTTDQRGKPNSTTYGSTICTDAGAVQTNYALNFTAPQPSDVVAHATMLPAPIVSVSESGSQFTAGSATVSLTDADTDLSASATTSAATAGGVATFSNLNFSHPETGDTLSVWLALNPSLNETALSSPFNVTIISQSITFAPTVTSYSFSAGSFAVSATATSGLSVSFVSTTGGVCSVSGTTVTILSVGTCTIQATQAGNTDYSAATPIAVNLTINQATLTITANNASKVYGTANPTFTGTVTGQQNGDTLNERFSTSATLSSPVNTYAIVPSVTGAHLADYTQVVTNGTLSVTQAGTTTELALSSASLTPGQNETLTAQVLSSTTGTPTGTVSFYDGTTLLSTVTLNSGAASTSTPTLAPGVTHSITATYSGDVNFTGSSSTASASTNITVAPLDFTMTISGPSTATVIPGQSISYQVSVTPRYGSYAGPVNFAVSGLPPGATVNFSPSSIAANAGPQTVTVTIQTVPATAMMHRQQPASPGRKPAPFALAFLLLFGAGALRKRPGILRSLLCMLVLASAGAAATMVSGCGGGGFFAQPPQNYTVTVTATAANLQHSTTITLNMQ